MKLAMRLADKSAQTAEADRDPREGESAEIIDLASRTAYPSVTQRKGKSDAMGMVAGVAIVAVLGMATLWGMNSARIEERQPQPAPQAASVVQPAEAPAPAAPAVAPGAGPAQLADPAPAPVLAAQPYAASAPAPAVNPYSSPTVVFDASSLPAPASGR